MTTNLTNVEAIKAYFEAKDRHAPSGGRQVKMEDYKADGGGIMSADAKRDLATLAVSAMNADLTTYGNASAKGPGPYAIG